MKLSNEWYDRLRFVADIVLPSLAVLVLTIFGIWGIPYGEAISGTIVAIDVFLAKVLRDSSKNYIESEDKE